jgi:protein TIF31
VNDWVGGYWLGPYSLRIPGKGGKANRTAQHEGDVGLLTKGKDGVVVREGERLSEWLEVGDVFGHVEERGEKVLEVVRGEQSSRD